MSKVDDELSRRFHRAERPVGAEDLLGGVARRRRRRRTLQRVQAGALGVAVLAATAGGFLALQDAFGEGASDRVGAPVPGNGQIVFTKEADDDRLEIFAATADGSVVRQLTDTELNNSDPAVSPDGSTVAFAHQTQDGATIATIPIEGGPIVWQTAEHRSVSDPVWSPDGTRIAFLAFTFDASELFVAEVGTDVARRIELAPEVTSSMSTDGLDTLEQPTWSPDGERIAVAVRTRRGSSIPSWDVLSMRLDGSGAEFVVGTDSRDETVPAWSPDGTKIAFLRWPAATPEEIEQRTEGGELWTIAPDGGSPRQIAVAVDALLRLGLTWAPDGSSLLVSDGEWIYRVDPTPEGDVRDNFVRLVRGFSPSWQPIPAGSEPSVTTGPESSTSPSPEPEGRDVGLGFDLCHAQSRRVALVGDDRLDTIWTGTRADPRETCSDVPAQDAEWHVAIDVVGDASVDAHVGPLACEPGCSVIVTPDMDGDGSREIVVGFFVYVPTAPGLGWVYHVQVGHADARLVRIDRAGGSPFVVSWGAGGAGSWQAGTGCPEPGLVVVWNATFPDAGSTWEVESTTYRLETVDGETVATLESRATGSEPPTDPRFLCGEDAPIGG